MKTKKLVYSIEIIRATALSRARGIELAREHPEIANRWKKGEYLKDLAREYCSNDTYAVGVNSIWYALKELIPENERKSIGRKHSIEGTIEPARIRGRTDYRLHRQLWNPKNAAKLKAGRKKGGLIGGSIAGKKNYKAGLGIAAMTHEERKEAGKRTALARGEIPYESRKKATEFGLMNERKYIEKLASLKREYAGYTWEFIAYCDNLTFRHNRSLESIRTAHNQNLKKERERYKLNDKEGHCICFALQNPEALFFQLTNH